MATTSPDNIWTPDSGDDYALTVDLAAMADTIQDAITAVPRNYRVGTDAQRLAITGGNLFEGLTFYTTNTNIEWFYNGSAWLPNDTNPTTLSLNSGWVAGDSPIRYLRRGNAVEILPFEVGRTGSGVSVGAGVSIGIATLPAGLRPSDTEILGTGSIGVAGNLGASRWLVSSGGSIIFQSMVATGTMAAGISVTNNITFGGGRFQL